jgi:hypothetical protein
MPCALCVAAAALTAAFRIGHELYGVHVAKAVAEAVGLRMRQGPREARVDIQRVACAHGVSSTNTAAPFASAVAIL